MLLLNWEKYKDFTKQAVSVLIFILQLAFKWTKKIQIERRFSNECLKIKTNVNTDNTASQWKLAVTTFGWAVKRGKTCAKESGLVLIGFGFLFGLDEVARGFLANSSKPIASWHSNENRSCPIKTRNYMQLTRNAGKRVWAGCHLLWPYFWLVEKVVRVFQDHLVAQQRKTSFISTLEWKTFNTALNKHRSDKYRIMTASFPKPPKNVLHWPRPANINSQRYYFESNFN